MDDISEMNANVLRTYTLHPPAFYEALAEHNVDRDDPLLLLHGNWLTEETLLETRDAFDPEIIAEHREGIQHVIDADDRRSESDASRNGGSLRVRTAASRLLAS
ncbi:hypothetical protein [Halosolutus gelatinilyticus]|uniref:hypothetical protein n=1 Tax=Halosolutus gelatinilyticus TaxID=2931975 RepID=UPI001FF2CCBC|nr:hypothetical protein [Halosolutus gelatinilyticus]